MARRKRLELDERRAQLLSLALAAFSTKSYDDVSIDDLAQAASVSKGLFYHYFPSKHDLYVSTVRMAAEQLAARIVPDESLPPLEQISRGLSAYLQYAEENADAYLSLMQGGVGRDQEVEAIVEEARTAFVRVMLERAGAVLTTPLSRTLIRGWVGMVEATSLDWLTQRSVPREELVRLLVKVLLYTIKLGMGRTQA